jgi:hypothetical protein
MRKVKALKVAILCLVLVVPIWGKSVPQPQQIIQAVRAQEPIILDGMLNETAWMGKGYSGFIQVEPKEGEPATEKTVVWVAYDDKAIYILARLYDSEPEQIVGRLGRRDDFVDSDWFIFSVDPYYDRRSGYQFAVNPKGTIMDWTIYNDEYNDSTWDGIWRSRTRIDEKGWTVEMKIPFEQLRFKKKDSYTWGVNFRRLIKRRNEEAGIVYIPRGESGFVSHFARLEGIKNINPGRYIEMVPYSIGKAAFSTKEEGNPFATGKDFLSNGGLDMKIGLKSNLTLDLTVNPDFGQVEVDPAQINLSAAETYYSERRPFFIEGANVFRFGRGGSNRNVGANWGDPSFFYSRRIGRPPQGAVDTDGYVSYPEWSTILGAAKITGKIGKDWNIGFLSALTQREYASIDLDGRRSRQEVEPFSYYGVLRAQKEFNQGRQGLGFITTSVLRNLRDDLKDSLNSNAFSFALDGWTFLDKDKTWVVSGWFGATQVTGSKERIRDLQHSYPHYFQRPDADHVELDPNATSMNGWAGRLTLNKQKGNFMFNAAIGAISPGFDSRDMGFQWDGDVINGHIMVGYRSFKPGKLFRYWRTLLFTQRNYDFGGRKIGEQRLIFIGNIQFLNYWSFYTQVSHNPPRWSNDLTRGGPLTLRPTDTWGEIGISSDDRKPLVFSFFNYFMTEKAGSWEWSQGIGLRWKPSSNFSISVDPAYSSETYVAQWVTEIEDALMTDTYGSRYIFGTIKRKTVSCSIRLNWIFSPTLSLQAYIQPYIAVGDYLDYKELARPRSFEFNRYGENGSTIAYDAANEEYAVDPDGSGPAPLFYFGNPDFNYKSLRGTIVLRWEYRPGSTLYVVWTQNRADHEYPGDFRFRRDFRRLLSAPGDDTFMIKFTYRFKM